MAQSKSVSGLMSRAQQRGISLGSLVFHETVEYMNVAEKDVWRKMERSLQVMKEARASGLEQPLHSESGLTTGAAHQLHREGRGFSGRFLKNVIAGALAVSEANACMGRIVAAPTAGSCGILPACLLALQDEFGYQDRDLVLGLFNAAGIGAVIAENASISGAAGGCQAECGSAAAMAASALVEVLGGTAEQCGHACAHALKSLMGLVCDPVAGLVEEPCQMRNASGAAVAVTAAEIALCGIKSVIPVDEVIEAMGEVGKMLPGCLRETSAGGLAATKTARALEKEIAARAEIEQCI